MNIRPSRDVWHQQFAAQLHVQLNGLRIVSLRLRPTRWMLCGGLYGSRFWQALGLLRQSSSSRRLP